MSAITPTSETVIDHEIAETIRRVPDIGAISFSVGDTATGRGGRLGYIVRSQIVSVVVTERGTSGCYLISVRMISGPLLTLDARDYDHMRSLVASFGCGDVASAGLAA